MKKIIGILLIAVALVFPQAAINVCAAEEHPPRVMDEADLLAPEEETELIGYLDEISERQQFDVAVTIVNSLGGEDIQYYAADYYDYGGYGMGENYDGAMFIMSMEEREWFILTTGYGIDVLTDSELDVIGEDMVPYLSSGDYLKAFRLFGEEVDFQVTSGVEEASPSILLSLLAGLLLGLIPAFIIRGKLKSVKMQTSAGSYENKGSKKITEKQDIFLYHTVHRTHRETESSSGGSSTFKGSSGRSHGGRGGSF